MKSADHELRTTQFSPVFCYFPPLLPKNLLQHPIIKHPEPVFLPWGTWDQLTHPYKTKQKYKNCRIYFCFLRDNFYLTQ
jgi:hypothetical protein